MLLWNAIANSLPYLYLPVWIGKSMDGFYLVGRVAERDRSHPGNGIGSSG